ncbi:MAG: GNAT family N-acetyltransferase [Actinomycetota bacterium]
MSIEIRGAEDDDLEALVHLDFRNFGGTVEDGDVDEVREEIDLDRFLVAVDGDRLVGAAGSYAMDLTLPGLGTVPMSGVTWVSVAASHRRRGAAAGLMAGLDELSADFDEPLLGLTASEGGIYERFGYGTATSIRVIELDRRRASIHPRFDPEPVVLVDGQHHRDELFEIYDRFRRIRVGEVSRSPVLHRTMTMDRKKPAFAAMHPDGYAIYSIDSQWHDGHPAHKLSVVELAAVTPEAHLALWNLLLSVDLVGPIRSLRAVSLGDPLPQLLTDQRALRTTDLNDGLWLKVTDPVRCFGARTYRADDRLVVGIVETVDDLLAGAEVIQTVAVGPDGCQEVDEAPDLVACRPALGPLLLGGAATPLAKGHRLRGDTEVLHRADVLFGSAIEPHCGTPF